MRKAPWMAGLPGSSPPAFLPWAQVHEASHALPAPDRAAGTAARPPAPLTPPATPRQAAALDHSAPHAQPAAQWSAASAALSLAELWEGIGCFLTCPLDLAVASATNAAARAALEPLLRSLRRVAAAELLHVLSVAAAVQDGPTQARRGPGFGRWRAGRYASPS